MGHVTPSSLNSIRSQLTDAKILEALMRDPSADISNLSIARIAFR